MQKANGHRLDISLADLFDHRLDALYIERDLDISAWPHSLFDLEPQLAADQGGDLVVEEVVELRDADAAQLQHVAKAGRGN